MLDAKTNSSTPALDADLAEQLPADLRAAVGFHGHLCPGLTMGYRAAHICMDRLDAERGLDEELVGIVETDACGVDAFQLITGCTLGKGNLIYKDYGKQAFTLVRRSDGQGVRVALSLESVERDPQHAELRSRVMTGEATSAEREQFNRVRDELVLRLLDTPAESLASITSVEVELPTQARIFDSVVCSSCGESVMEPRSRITGGQPHCIPCATRYERGWEINA